MLARRGLSAALIVACSAAAPVRARSLGDVARQEEARRATAKKATKSFSNADLKPSEIAPPSGGAPAGESCYMSISKNRCVSAEELLASTSENIAGAERAKQEPNWRRQAATIRDRLNKAQQEVDTLSSNASDQARSPGERGAAQRVPREWLDPRPILSPRMPR